MYLKLLVPMGNANLGEVILATVLVCVSSSDCSF